MGKSLKLKEVKLEKREIYKTQMKDKTKDRKDIAPSATEDCADVTSRYERYEKENKNATLKEIHKIIFINNHGLSESFFYHFTKN